MGIGYAEYEPEDQKEFIKTVTVANYYPNNNNHQGVSKDNVPDQKFRLLEGSRALKLIHRYERCKKQYQRLS